uniref:Beta-N-acetylhexosaminidase n=1 Tax=Rhabditophanes sp. KR3021 TaxID=114890 RepID=A0AC35TNN1_9BILA
MVGILAGLYTGYNKTEKIFFADGPKDGSEFVFRQKAKVSKYDRMLAEADDLSHQQKLADERERNQLIGGRKQPLFDKESQFSDNKINKISGEVSSREMSLKMFKESMKNVHELRDLPNNNIDVINDKQVDDKQTDGGDDSYPNISPYKTFIPSRRYIHLDLKGGAYRPEVFPKLFLFFKRIGINGILLEWEDMFPYTDGLEGAVNDYAYTMPQVEGILKSAIKDYQMEVIPLVQTFGHLEWLLKLEKYAYLREAQPYPQAICIGKEEAFAVVKKMIDQVAKVHQKYGMKYFNIGADEVYQIGLCPETISLMSEKGYDQIQIMLWHIARTADYVKFRYGVSVHAWHDMLVQVPPEYLYKFKLDQLIEPIIWSYAEDLEQYLPYQTWLSLKPFKKVWGASAIKGADGPRRYHTNAAHYVKNHISWTKQMTIAYPMFDSFQGLFFSAWSRYDHMAMLTELMPVALPTLAMSVETIMAGRGLVEYEKTNQILKCMVPIEDGNFQYGCEFPGSQIYELVNEFRSFEVRINKYFETDHEYGGWLTEYSTQFKITQPMRVEKLKETLNNELWQLQDLASRLRTELSKMYFNETADEFLFTNAGGIHKKITDGIAFAQKILKAKNFPKRPFLHYKEL